MQRIEKDNAINNLKGRLEKAQSIVLFDFRGLPVEADCKMRNEFRAAGCEYKVVKNSIIGLATKGTPMEAVEPLLRGPTAVAYSYEDPAAPARIATKVAKEQAKFVIKGGFVDGRVLDKGGVEALSTLPGKDELRGTFLATLLAGPQNFVRLLAAAPQNFVYLLSAQEEKLKEGDGSK